MNTSTRQGFTAPGFTLIELMVVLAIAALLTAMTLSGYSQLRTGNARVSCQTNLNQISIALHLYLSDYDGMAPAYNPLASPSGVGLWLLWGYQWDDPANPDRLTPVGQAPVGLYLKSVKSLHCPQNIISTPPYEISPVFYRLNGQPGDPQIYNPEYLSYQVPDDTQFTYQPVRVASSSDPDFDRQLTQKTNNIILPRPAASNTVVTWCRWHRAGGRDMDNVLFFDGSVQLIPREQFIDGETSPRYGWQRLPRASG